MKVYDLSNRLQLCLRQIYNILTCCLYDFARNSRCREQVYDVVGLSTTTSRLSKSQWLCQRQNLTNIGVWLQWDMTEHRDATPKSVLIIQILILKPSKNAQSIFDAKMAYGASKFLNLCFMFSWFRPYLDIIFEWLPGHPLIALGSLTGCRSWVTKWIHNASHPRRVIRESPDQYPNTT